MTDLRPVDQSHTKENSSDSTVVEVSENGQAKAGGKEPVSVGEEVLDHTEQNGSTVVPVSGGLGDKDATAGGKVEVTKGSEEDTEDTKLETGKEVSDHKPTEGGVKAGLKNAVGDVKKVLKSGVFGGESFDSMLHSYARYISSCSGFLKVG